MQSSFILQSSVFSTFFAQGHPLGLKENLTSNIMMKLPLVSNEVKVYLNDLIIKKALNGEPTH
jgi:hypothetical protein